MADLLKMDLYRMRKSKSFLICLIIAFVLAFSSEPLTKLLYMVAATLSPDIEPFENTARLADILSRPLPLINSMLVLLSACSFFYADAENGYIKNIAGQTARKSDCVLSKFFAMIPHNLLFMAVGILGSLLGSILVLRVTFDSGIWDALRIILLKLLLLQAVCSILLLVTGVYRSKPLGFAIAVLMGMGFLFLLYTGIDSALGQIFKNKSFMIGDYMPDQLMLSSDPDTLTSIIVSAVTIGIFLPVSLSVFNKREVK